MLKIWQSKLNKNQHQKLSKKIYYPANIAIDYLTTSGISILMLPDYPYLHWFTDVWQPNPKKQVGLEMILGLIVMEWTKESSN